MEHPVLSPPDQVSVIITAGCRQSALMPGLCFSRYCTIDQQTIFSMFMNCFEQQSQKSDRIRIVSTETLGIRNHDGIHGFWRWGNIPL